MTSQSHYKGIPYSPSRQDGDLVIKPISLDIIWGKDPRYWRLPQSQTDYAELLQVCWLEVSGSVELNQLNPGKHKISFALSLKPDAFGWAGSPIYLMVKVGSGGFKWKSYNLSTMGPTDKKRIPDDFCFEVGQNDTSGGEKLHFGLYEIWRGRWKGGLLIHEVVISKATG
ncbi:protein PHLOEM PROTEIN 2-LIKE A9-like [Magnolia sinica]|uniref:protein PHLOEM PROTEIN 2-LIKE A9-like n=1 Tax=Magnolia sinica TaxID=86752 RepID=UPI00265A61E0|nr:protein PHLOEM PROTEIN 2-LIKE A9-like [Magnolia sinica]